MKTRRIKPAGRPGKELARMLNALGHRHSLERVFRDFVEMSALAISNAVDLAQHKKREAQYMDIVKRYDSAEASNMAKMLSLLVDELELSLGECVFAPLMSELELFSSNRKYFGQFFTPWSLSYMMAKMTFGPKSDIEKMMHPHGFVTAMEPACGAGAMVLAMARALMDEGIDYQRCLHVTAVDIDPMCAHMTYVQASLVGIPACIIHGDSIRLTEHAAYYTPLHVLHGWGPRLRFARKADALRDLIVAPGIKDIPAEDIAAVEEIAVEALPIVAEVLAEQGRGEVMTPAIAPSMAQWAMRIASGSSPPFPTTPNSPS